MLLSLALTSIGCIGSALDSQQSSSPTPSISSPTPLEVSPPPPVSSPTPTISSPTPTISSPTPSAGSPTPGGDDDTHAGTDSDGDGYPASLDCDDGAVSVYPGAPETCNNLDDDCDGQVDDGLVFQSWYLDKDGDSFGTSSQFTSACTQPQGFVGNSTDCDDSLSTSYPGALEVCNGRDDDCDTKVDEGLSLETWYADDDGDGYGELSESLDGCGPPEGYVADAGDCDDANDMMYPGAMDSADDGLDSNCNGFQDWVLRLAGVPDYNGDGMPATRAALYRPAGMAVANNGIVYIADTSNCRIRAVDQAGVITTVAGTGIESYGGDGGPATEAHLRVPRDVAVDPNGNIYIADSNNYLVRRVDVAGRISTYAGNGSSGYSGDGGPATSAKLKYPGALSFDNELGSLYIADTGNYRIRKVDVTGKITTVVGTGASGTTGDGGLATLAKISSPEGVVAGLNGEFFVSDSANNRVRRIDAGGKISAYAGTTTAGYSGDNGPATAAQLSAPHGLALDGTGGLFISDYGNQRICWVDASGKITTYAGTGAAGFAGDGYVATVALLSGPTSVARSKSGDLYIADRSNQRIRKVDTNRKISTTAGIGVTGQGFSGDGGPATDAFLREAADIAVDASGNVFIADSGNYRVRKIGSDGDILTVADIGTDIRAIALDASGDVFLSTSSKIYKVDSIGTITTFAGKGSHGFSGDGGPATAALLDNPAGIAIATDGSVFIADESNSRIRKVDQDGIISTVAGTGNEGFSGDAGPATAATLFYPLGVAVDEAGVLYIADSANERIRMVDLDGIITTIAGTGVSNSTGDGGPAVDAGLSAPGDLAFDRAGRLYIASSSEGGSYGNLVRRIELNDSISTVIGTGYLDCTGDNSPASTASFGWAGIDVDNLGNLYIADSFNSRVLVMLP